MSDWPYITGLYTAPEGQFPTFHLSSPRGNCEPCHGTGRAERPRTADHILTDSAAWKYCDACSGSGSAPSLDADRG